MKKRIIPKKTGNPHSMRKAAKKDKKSARREKRRQSKEERTIRSFDVGGQTFVQRIGERDGVLLSETVPKLTPAEGAESILATGEGAKRFAAYYRDSSQKMREELSALLLKKRPAGMARATVTFRKNTEKRVLCIRRQVLISVGRRETFREEICERFSLPDLFLLSR